MRARSCLGVGLMLAVVLLPACFALGGTTERVSVASDGTEGNGYSDTWPPSYISADGRFVAFASLASNLVPGDTNGWNDVFVHDRQTGQTTRVSVASSGQDAPGNSRYPSISADGRFVAFSGYRGLVPGDTNKASDVFVHDRYAPRPPLEFFTERLRDGVVGEPYSAPLEGNAGLAPYTWSIIEGSLPDGLGLDPATGVVSGTPTTAGTWNFTARVVDSSEPVQVATGPVSITVKPTDITVVSVSARDIHVGGKYAITTKIRNDTSSTDTIHVDCVVDDGAGGTQALATKTVTVDPTETVTLRFTDKSKLGPGSCTATVTVQEDPDVGPNNSATFLIKGHEPAPLEITTESLPDAVVGQPYSARLEATGGTTPYTWAIVAGSLPGGLTLDPNTGVISATPTTVQTAAFTVSVTDSSEAPPVVTKELGITVNPAPLPGSVAVESVVARDIRVGRKYNITASIRNGTSEEVSVVVLCEVDSLDDPGVPTQTLDARLATIAPGETAAVKFNDPSDSSLSKGNYVATVTVQDWPDAEDSDTFRIK